MKRYQGSCHCKRVQFEIQADLEGEGTMRCNCTSCAKRRWWSVKVKPEHFTSLGGEQEMVNWREGGIATGGGFCKHCGIVPYAAVAAAEWNDGAYYSVNVAALDGLDPATLDKVKIIYLDGLHDTWQPTTEHTGYL